MSPPSNQTTFSFVEYQGPRASHNAGVRRMIRQQAMKEAGDKRRSRGNYGKHNLRQLPVFVEPDRPTTNSCHMPVGDATLEQKLVYLSKTIPQAPPSCAKYKLLGGSFPLLQLLPLAGLRLGITPYSHLGPQPTGRQELFSASHPASQMLLSCIPRRYGETPCLSYAVDCVLAKMRQLVMGPSPPNDACVFMHYARALKSVQAALDDEDVRMNPETLCATQLLGIFELLHGGSSTEAWMRHVVGAARLIEARGVDRFQTSFESALFLENIGPTVMHALLTDTTSFLAEEKWQNVIRTAVFNNTTFSGQEELVFRLWGSLVQAPRLFRDTTRIVMANKPVTIEAFDETVVRLLTARQHLLLWLVKAEEQAGQRHQDFKWCGNGIAFPWPAGASKRDPASMTQLALYGTYLMCRMFKARLLYALEPFRFHHLEVESQELAGRVMEMKQELGGEDGGRTWAMFMSQSAWIAKGILETRDMWEESRDIQTGTIEQWKFQRWCDAIGRKISSET